jgi:hypothetical protein
MLTVFPVDQMPPSTASIHAKRNEDPGFQHDDLSTDVEVVKDQFLDKVPEDVRLASAEKEGSELWKQHATTSSAEKLAKNVRRNRSLKDVLQDFAACARDPNCDVQYEDFVNGV